MLALACFAAGCDRPEDTVQVVSRDHRFGIFRDLVLFQRPQADGGPFFLDRFETTVAGFARWTGVEPESDRVGPDFRPVSMVSLLDARRFARWRFCRIPRWDEWDYAATQSRNYVFPWGEKFRPTLANTSRLGLEETTPVGTFASGGSDAGPFDLIGNVAEWTETAALPYVRISKERRLVREVRGLPEWPIYLAPDAAVDGDIQDWPEEQTGAIPQALRMWLPLWSPMPSAWLTAGMENRDDRPFDIDETPYWADVDVEQLDMPGVVEFESAPSLACWLPAWSLAPTDWLVAGVSDQVKREVLGGHFRSRIPPNEDRRPAPLQWEPRREGFETGIRLAADPAGLLEALLSFDGSLPETAAVETLRRFLRRHREVLEAHWARAARRVPRAGTLFQIVRSELPGG